MNMINIHYMKFSRNKNIFIYLILLVYFTYMYVYTPHVCLVPQRSEEESEGCKPPCGWNQIQILCKNKCSYPLSHVATSTGLRIKAF